HVSAVGNDLGAAVVFLDPRNDDRGIETARVREDNLLDRAHSLSINKERLCRLAQDSPVGERVARLSPPLPFHPGLAYAGTTAPVLSTSSSAASSCLISLPPTTRGGKSRSTRSPAFTAKMPRSRSPLR